MDRTRFLRVVAGVAAAIAITTGGPVLAAGSTVRGPTAAAAPSAVAPEATCSPGAHACPIRIRFESGAYSGQAHSHLSGITSQKWFVLHARAGQTMVVVVKGDGPTRGTVYFPGGGSSGQPGGRIFDASVPRTGDYLVRVTESQMAEEWSGGVDVVALIY